MARGGTAVWLTGAVMGIILAAGSASAGLAESVKVAVAANFTGPAKQIAAAFEKKTGNTVRLSFGATGGLFAQIAQGAPFDVFLSADLARPEKAVAEGLAVKGSLFTYALGRLVLFGPDTDLSMPEAVLKGQKFEKLAVADPKLAPYGAAAAAALKHLGLYAALKGKLVYGANVTQTLQFVHTGNAALGFVALSQVKGAARAHLWVVPETFYPPVEQGAVLLMPGADNRAAKAFLAFLAGPEGQKTIASAGYGLQTTGSGGEKPLKDCGA